MAGTAALLTSIGPIGGITTAEASAESAGAPSGELTIWEMRANGASNDDGHFEPTIWEMRECTYAEIRALSNGESLGPSHRPLL